MRNLLLIVLVLLFIFPVEAVQRKRVRKQRAKVVKAHVPKPLHPCETAEDRELGRRFSHNCSHADSKYPAVDWPPK